MAINYRKKNVIFIAKKVVALTNIEIMSNGKQKNFGKEIKNCAEIKANITQF